jgi:hypothetical protein
MKLLVNDHSSNNFYSNEVSQERKENPNRIFSPFSCNLVLSLPSPLLSFWTKYIYIYEKHVQKQFPRQQVHFRKKKEKKVFFIIA